MKVSNAIATCGMIQMDNFGKPLHLTAQIPSLRWALDSFYCLFMNQCDDYAGHFLQGIFSRKTVAMLADD